jgi:glycosyltransferase involved in cell wall biosynthesis
MAGAPLAELFSNAGLFVLPSTHEGLPIALLEAMSYGRALLLSDLPVYRAMGLPEDCLFPWVTRRTGAAAGRGLCAALLPVDWSAALDAYRWDEVARRTAAVYADVLEHG